MDKVILTLALLVAAYLLITSLYNWGLFDRGTKSASETLQGIPSTQTTQALMGLDSGAPQDIPAYSRDKFGQSWADVTHSGCDTRNEVLMRDMDNLEYRPNTQECIIERGTLDDPYTGKQISFQRGNKTSTAVQIDHVVALSDAWRSGAYAWNDQERLQFANDPLNLLAVDGPANESKSNYAADEWLPDNEDYQCQFVARQIAVKNKYSLSVTEAERDAIAEVLVTCPDQKLPK